MLNTTKLEELNVEYEQTSLAYHELVSKREAVFEEYDSQIIALIKEEMDIAHKFDFFSHLELIKTISNSEKNFTITLYYNEENSKLTYELEYIVEEFNDKVEVCASFENCSQFSKEAYEIEIEMLIACRDYLTKYFNLYNLKVLKDRVYNAKRDLHELE
jgi:hypothetical protein